MKMNKDRLSASQCPLKACLTQKSVFLSLNVNKSMTSLTVVGEKVLMPALQAFGPLLLHLKCHYHSPLAPICFGLVLHSLALHPLVARKYQKHSHNNSNCTLVNTVENTSPLTRYNIQGNGQNKTRFSWL